MRNRLEGAIYRQGIMSQVETYSQKVPHVPIDCLIVVATARHIVQLVKSSGYEHLKPTLRATLELLSGHPDRILH